MPAISAEGTFTADTPGWDFLRPLPGSTVTMLFAGSTLPSTSLVVQYIDDAGTARTFENGTITALPTSLTIGPISVEMQIVATGGTPSLNVTGGGITRGMT